MQCTGHKNQVKVNNYNNNNNQSHLYIEDHICRTNCKLNTYDLFTCVFSLCNMYSVKLSLTFNSVL